MQFTVIYRRFIVVIAKKIIRIKRNKKRKNYFSFGYFFGNIIIYFIRILIFIPTCALLHFVKLISIKVSFHISGLKLFFNQFYNSV